MKYAVISQFYDSGKVAFSKIQEVPDYVQDSVEEGRSCTTYTDVFNTKKEAQEFIDENKEN
jgi:hypothetical protein